MTLKSASLKIKTFYSFSSVKVQIEIAKKLYYYRIKQNKIKETDVMGKKFHSNKLKMNKLRIYEFRAKLPI